MKKFLLPVFSVLSYFLHAQCNVSITANAVNASCYNACDGSASISVSGGSAPYTYTWAPSGANMPTNNGLCAGNYTVGATDANGCTGSAIVTISQPPAVIVTAAASSSQICAGQTTTLTCNGAMSYTWNPPGYTGAQVVDAPSTTTTYTLTGSNNGCVGYATVTVLVNPSPSLTFSVSPTGTPQVWDIVANYSGGTPSYTYLWSWGDGTSDNTPYPTHNYASAGMYNICGTVTDQNGCSDQVCQNDSVYRTSSAGAVITVNVINGATAINSPSLGSLQVFPVPASNSFTIMYDGSYEFSLVDLNARIIMQQSARGKLTVNTEELNEGVYLLQLKDSANKLSRKTIVIQR